MKKVQLACPASSSWGIPFLKRMNTRVAATCMIASCMQNALVEDYELSTSSASHQAIRQVAKQFFRRSELSIRLADAVSVRSKSIGRVETKFASLTHKIPQLAGRLAGMDVYSLELVTQVMCIDRHLSNG